MTRVRLPSHVAARGKKHAGCQHLQSETHAQLTLWLERYMAGLRYGQKLLDGHITPRDGSDDAPMRRGKRCKVRVRHS